MWRRRGEYLYSFQYTETGYTLVYTDLRRAFRESVTNADLIAKADKLECPFDVSSPLPFLKTMDKGLESASFGETVSIDFQFTGVAFKWVCEPTELAQPEVIDLLNQLVTSMFTVIDNISEFLNAQRQTIVQKNSVIDGLSDSVQRKVWYRVPTSLVNAYNNRTEPEQVPQGMDLVNRFWPKDVERAIFCEPSAKRVKLEESDATVGSDSENDENDEDDDPDETRIADYIDPDDTRIDDPDDSDDTGIDDYDSDDTV